jgi:hypothetical protein
LPGSCWINTSERKRETETGRENVRIRNVWNGTIRI